MQYARDGMLLETGPQVKLESAGMIGKNNLVTHGCKGFQCGMYKPCSVPVK